jgi:hypothetical protein
MATAETFRIPTPESARARLLDELSNKIAKSTYPLFTAKELKDKVKLTEEEWFVRSTGFVEDAKNGFPNTGLVRDLTRGLLTKLFTAHLGQQTVAKFATVVKDAPLPKKYKGLGTPRNPDAAS